MPASPQRIVRSRPDARLRNDPVVITTIAIALSGAVSFEMARGHQGPAELVVVGLVLLVLLAVPLSWLPIAAVTVCLTVPADQLGLPAVVHGAVLPMLPFAAWLLRSQTARTGWGPLRALGVVVGAWLILSEVFAPIRTNQGIKWFLCALLTTAAVAVLERGELDAAGFRRYFLNLTTPLALFAIVEGMLGENPVYGRFYSQHISWSQDWSTYRATTLMGHPIFNGTIFATAIVLTASDILAARARMSTSLIRFGVLVGGLAATQSRGAAIAVLPGLLTVLVFQRSGRGQGTRKLALVALGALAIGTIATSLAARNDSAEGRDSAAVRSAMPARAKASLEGTTIFGAGPGQAEAYRVVRQLQDSDMPLENSYAELFVALGPLGALVFTALLVGAVLRGLGTPGRVGEASALLTILVAIAGYNAIESRPSLLVLVGLLICSIMAAGPQPAALGRPGLLLGASRPGRLQVGLDN